MPIMNLFAPPGRIPASMLTIRIPLPHQEDSMRKIEHALTGAVYEWAADEIGPVLVTDKAGRQGRFDRDGGWVMGEIYSADPELCRWIVSGGPKAGGAGSRSRRFEAEETFS